MVAKKKAKRNQRDPRRLGADAECDAMMIETFCRRHSISISGYYVLRTKGLTPRETVVGGRRLITKESAAAWRAEREAASTAA